MKKQIPWENHRSLATACLLVWALADPMAALGTARPVEETVNAGGTTYTMWPESLCPADPVTDSACIDPVVDFPPERESTSYGGSQTPARGLEFFYDLDIVEDETLTPSETYLYMAYNSGFQIWDITGENAKNPLLLSSRDGFFGEFFKFESGLTHNWQLIFDLDAVASVDAQAASGEVLIAVAAGNPVGLSIWNAANKTDPVQLYQDPTRSGFQVAASVIDGRTYAFFATPNGVHVYDMTRAREVGACNEEVSTCGGANPVYRGVLGQGAKYLDVLETVVPTPTGSQTRHYVSFSDANIGTALGLEIREITDPASAASTKVVDGLTLSATQGLVFGNDLFEYDGRYYVGAVNVDDLEIYDVTPCITVGPSDPACGFANLRVGYPTNPPTPSPQFVQYSENNGVPFLYKGAQALFALPPLFGGPDIEFLLDLSEIAADVPEEQRAKRILADEYPDPVNGRRINYWTTYYDKATDGYSAYSPISGRFHDGYFYHSGQTIFSVHYWRGELPPSVAISPLASGDRWLSTTDPQQDEWIPLGMECLPSGVDTNWLWSTPTPNALLDDNDVPSPRVQATLCADDTYPAAACAGQDVQVDLTADCDGAPLVAAPLALTLADPRPFVSGIEIDEAASGAPPYSVCQELSFATSGAITGKSETRTFEWRITPLGSGGVERSCPGDPALACTESSLTWSTTGSDLGVVFTDGFESGNTTAWGTTRFKGTTGTHQVTLSLASPTIPAAVPFEATTEVSLTPLAALSLSQDIFTPSGPNLDGSYDFTALATGATAYHWEFEQAPGLAGNDPSCAVNDTVPCCRLMTDCQVVEESMGQVNYAWPPVGNASGLHEIGLEISNCDPGNSALSDKRDVDIIVSDAVAPEIDAFFLVNDADCECTGFFGPECHCFLTGSGGSSVTANVTVDVTGTCSSLEINWGDGDVDSGLACNEASYSHPYDTLGSYELTAEACLGALCDTQVRFTSPSVLLDIE